MKNFSTVSCLISSISFLLLVTPFSQILPATILSKNAFVRVYVGSSASKARAPTLNLMLCILESVSTLLMLATALKKPYLSCISIELSGALSFNFAKSSASIFKKLPAFIVKLSTLSFSASALSPASRSLTSILLSLLNLSAVIASN